MKAYDANVELTVIKSICDSPKKTFILSKINADWFGSDAAKEVYTRINVFLTSGKGIPSSDVMKFDEALSDATRALISTPAPVLTTEDDCIAALDQMNKYRKARILMNAVTGVITELKNPNADVDKQIQLISNSLQSCHSGLSKNEILSINAADVDDLMNYVEDHINAVEDSFIPSGFREFDKKNGGFKKKNIIVLASTPGGGKSAMALQMAINQYMMGYNVMFVGMEMSADENMYRVMASVTKVDHGDINLKKLSQVQKAHIRKAFREWILSTGNKNRFDIWEPSNEIDMTDIGMELKARGGYDICYVDYIGLLKAYPKMASWEVLAVHSKQAKIQANAADVCMVLLAQKSTEEDALKYSQAINQTAHVVWMWDNDELAKQSGVVEVRQTKVRNGEVFPFHLQRDFKTMTFKDYFGALPTLAEVPERRSPPGMKELRG